MTEPRLTEQAEADLGELWADIGAHNPAAADRLSRKSKGVRKSKESGLFDMPNVFVVSQL